MFESNTYMSGVVYFWFLCEQFLEFCSSIHQFLRKCRESTRILVVSIQQAVHSWSAIQFRHILFYFLQKLNPQSFESKTGHRHWATENSGKDVGIQLLYTEEAEVWKSLELKQCTVSDIRLTFFPSKSQKAIETKLRA